MSFIRITFQKNNFIRISDFFVFLIKQYFYIFEKSNNGYNLLILFNEKKYETLHLKYISDIFYNIHINKYTIFIAKNGIDILKKHEYMATINNKPFILNYLTENKNKLGITEIIDGTKKSKNKKITKMRILPILLPEELIIHQLSYFTPKEIMEIKDQYKILNEKREDVWCYLLKEHFNIDKKENCYEEYKKNMKISLDIPIDISCGLSHNFNFKSIFSSYNTSKYIFLVYKNKIWLFTDFDYFINFLRKNNVKGKDIERDNLQVYLIKNNEKGFIYNISPNDYFHLQNKHLI
jgi:hypothetical protein